MSCFDYTARTRSGEKVSGRVEASDKATAVREIERRGHFPVSVKPAAQPPPSVAESTSSCAEEPPQRRPLEPGDGPVGVGGWLLFLCVLLTLLTPIGNVAGLIAIWHNVDDAVKSQEAQYHKALRDGSKRLSIDDAVQPHEALHTAAVAVTAITLVVTALSLLSGLALWTVQPYAVELGKGYLSLYIITHFACYIIMLCAVLQIVPRGQPPPNEVFQLPGGIGIATGFIWLQYLRKSKRVRATFPASFRSFRKLK